MSELREKLADQEHDRWSGWMRDQFSKGTLNEDGSWTMPAELEQRWKRQANTPYSELSEAEKDSDRAEVDKTLAVIYGENEDRIKELEIALIATDDALFWLLNLLHGNSKGGPDFSPPNNAEWEGAIGQGKEAHEVAEKALGGTLS